MVERITSHGTGDTLLERVTSDSSINVRGGHWEEAEEWHKADLKLVVDDPETFRFDDQTPLWHNYNVMLSVAEDGEMYFMQWDTE